MNINIQTSGVEMTDAINSYATDKAASLEKYFDGITGIDVIVGMHGNHHNKGKVYFTEMSVYVPGKTLFIQKDAEDLYKSIDKVRDHLKVEFEKMKGKMRQVDKEALRQQKGYQEEDESGS